jgi:ribosomal protein L7/L12
MADLKKFAETLVSLTVLEVNELKTILKDEYNIEPAAAAVAVAGPAAEAAPAEDAKSDWTITLKLLKTLLVLVLVNQRQSLTAYLQLLRKKFLQKKLKLQRNNSKKLVLQ